VKVVVTNAVLSNSGDAAIFEGIRTALIREGVCSADEISVHDSNASVTGALYPDWKIFQQLTVSPRTGTRVGTAVRGRLRRGLVKILTSSPGARRALSGYRGRVGSDFVAAAEDLVSSEVVISSGGTYLVDHYDFSHRVTELTYARALGKRIVLWTQSMGPFASPRALSSVRDLSSSVDAAFFRDRKSREAWTAAVGESAAMPVVPDVAFALFDASSTEAGPPRNAVQAPRRAVLSVRKWSAAVGGGDFDFQDYVQGMRDVAEFLIAEGWECIALSTCQGVNGYNVDDSVTAQEMFAGLDVVIDTAHHSPEELTAVIQSAQLVISTRMHLAILSLVARTPVLAVAYEFKTLELFKSLGIEEFVVEIERIDIEWFRERYAAMTAAPELGTLSVEALTTLSDTASSPALAVRALVPS
jgi:colanic acid/amylovoran biosynthesis protein